MKFKYRYDPIIILILISALISCGEDENKQAITVPIDAQAGSVYLEPDIYQAYEMEYESHSGVIVVPENRSKPDSRLIEIPIVQIHATGDSIAEPLFFLNGGPGNPNIDSYRFVNDLINNHDIVLVGYRGVDGSEVLNCPEIDEFFGNLPGDLTEQSTLDSMAAAYSRCAGRIQNEGVDTDGYTMTEVIQDFEDTRLALGYNRINLLSASYGTRLAMIYSWMYPMSINRSAMISVNPPGRFEWRPEVMDEQIKYYSDLYKKDPEYGARTDNLAETVRDAACSMPDRWLFFPIKKGHVLIGTFMMLYHTDSAPDVFDAWIAAGEGDWSGIALLSLSVDFMLAGASVWGDQAAKAMCADYIFEADGDPLAEFMPLNSIIGAPGSLLGIAAAKGWPGNIIADSLRHVQPSEVPTLLISGSIDFSTPARFARDDLLPFLKNGRQVILSEFGHTGDVWGKQRQALIHMLKTFYKTGAVDDSRFTYAPMSFDVGLGYPTIMKLIVAGAIIIIMIILWIIWRVVKKIHRRRLLRKLQFDSC